MEKNSSRKELRWFIQWLKAEDVKLRRGIGYSTAKIYLSKDEEYIKLRMEVRLRTLR